MPGRVDEIQLVGLAVARLVLQRSRLRLDGDAALALQVHGVEHLLGHLAVRQAAAALDEAVGKRRLAVVDVRDDREVADVLHRRVRIQWIKGGHPLDNSPSQSKKPAYEKRVRRGTLCRPTR